jgi:hypothetical protein
MITKVESEGEAVDGFAPVNSRKDFARDPSPMLERAPVGIFAVFGDRVIERNERKLWIDGLKK